MKKVESDCCKAEETKKTEEVISAIHKLVIKDLILYVERKKIEEHQ